MYTPTNGNESHTKKNKAIIDYVGSITDYPMKFWSATHIFDYEKVSSEQVTTKHQGDQYLSSHEHHHNSLYTSPTPTQVAPTIEPNCTSYTTTSRRDEERNQPLLQLKWERRRKPWTKGAPMSYQLMYF